MGPLIDYIEKEYGVEVFLGWMQMWWEDMDWDFPKFLVKSLPPGVFVEHNGEGYVL